MAIVNALGKEPAVLIHPQGSGRVPGIAPRHQTRSRESLHESGSEHYFQFAGPRLVGEADPEQPVLG